MIAVIDIGTHSALLLIGEKKPDGALGIVEDRLVITRLGEGLLGSRVISADAADRTMAVLKSFMETCDKHRVKRIKVVGTAALRNAQNSKAFISRIKTELGLDVEVISGQKEARLTYESSALDFGKEITVVDIGGGSSEIITGPPPLSVVSMPLGCVMLTEEYIRSDPVDEDDEKMLRNGIYDILCDQIPEALRSSQGEVVATAGTATTLLAMHFEIEPYEGKLVHGQRLDIQAIDALINDMRQKPLEELRSIKGLMPERAEVIFAGAVLLEEILRYLGAACCIISDRGIRWGVLYEELCRT
jgi:exopolyphosphatase/guanosine-5'-triphosphate,3'-diphosphate pyrophosphatase